MNHKLRKLKNRFVDWLGSLLIGAVLSVWGWCLTFTVTKVIAVLTVTCFIFTGIVAQGMAQEDRTSSMINKTSYVENCETSAVGRCLGFLGIGVEDSIASAEEVEMAIAKQDLPADADVFSKAVAYIKEGKNKPERKERHDKVVAKYKGELGQDKLRELAEVI